MSSPKPTKGRPVSRTEAARAGGSSSGLPVVIVAVVVVVLIGIGVIIAVRMSGDDGDETVDAGVVATSPAAGDQATAPVEVEGDPLTPLDQAGDDDPALGAAAPTLVGETPGDEAITIDPSADGPMLIAFVAHWCPHCQAEVPRIVDLFGGEAELDGVELVAVSTGANPAADENYPPGQWLAGEGWPGRTLVDDEQQSAFLAYGGGSYPYLVAVDADGNVAARASGEQGQDGLEALVAAAAGTSG